MHLKEWQLISLLTKTTKSTDQLDTHTRLTALCAGLPGSAGTRKVKPIWILPKQETVSWGLSAGYQPRPQVVDRGTTARYGGQLRYI